MFYRIHQAIDRIGDLPGVLQWRKMRFDERFAKDRNANYYHGIYPSFEAAAAGAPPTKHIGYDNPESTTLYDDMTEPLLKDYPAMFWLERSFGQNMHSVFDLGGHVGFKYYAFDRIIRYPEQLRWSVCDVAAVVSRGQNLARRRDSRGALRFTIAPVDMQDCDVLYASGSLQYLPQTLAEILRQCKAMPSRLVINSTALHPERSFVTLNSIGTAFCPYRVQKEADFIKDLDSLGYTVRDRWETPKDFVIRFEQGYDLDHFVGMCLDRR